MPYHRLESPTQTKTDAKNQQTSGEIWGRAPSNGSIPTVKAYRGNLPTQKRGIEFTSTIPPTKGTGTPYEARWYPCIPGVNPCSAQVQIRQVMGIDFAVISAQVTKNTQVP